MLANEKIGEAGEDACEVALNYLRLEGFILAYKRFTNRDGREDFEVMSSDGTIYNIEQKNHKAGSYWTPGQAAKYVEQIKGSGVKVLLKSNSTFKPRAKEAILKLGVRIIEFGEQILEVSAKAVGNVLTVLEGLVEPRSIRSFSISSVKVSVARMARFCSVVRGVFQKGLPCTIVQASKKLDSWLHGLGWMLPLLDDLVFGSGFGADSLVGSIGLIVIVVILLKVLGELA